MIADKPWGLLLWDYAKDIAKLGDRIVNAICGPLFNSVHANTFRWSGPFGGREWISTSLGHIKHMHGGTIPSRYPISRGVSWVLDKLDMDHVEEAHAEDPLHNDEHEQGGIG